MGKKPELMAPCADWSTLVAAIDAGADSVYFGVKELNMRVTAKNFTLGDLKEITTRCKEKGVKAYLTINVITYEKELSVIENIVKAAKDAGIDSIICWDPSVISLCKQYEIPFCISTQASISNSRSARYYQDMGAHRIVLARECTLEDIKSIRKNTDAEIEVFAHGAMCVAVSGRCFMSQFMYGKSANRGACIQPCRREYLITDPEVNKSLVVGNNYVMSAKDLCTLPFIDQLIDAGAEVFKIEGRTKAADYVKVTVESYREAIDAHMSGNLTNALKDRLMKKLSSVYTRGFSSGFYLGRPIAEFAEQYGGVAKKVKRFSGIVDNYFSKPMAAEIRLEASGIKIGDEAVIIGPTTGCLIFKVESLQVEGAEVTTAKKGTSVGLRVPKIVRKNDRFYINVEQDRGQK